MPITITTAGVMTDLCPCHDLATWPNTEVPMPRTAVDNRDQLMTIQQRLVRGQDQLSPEDQAVYTAEEASTFLS